jgi:putative transcriptional regulator
MPIVTGSRDAALRALREVDWAKIDALTDDQIADQIASNPDAAPDMAPEIDVAAIRKQTGLSQARFAETFGFNVRTLQEWERGAKRPSGPARTLLTVIRREPEAVKRALAET